jgi:hypothetical protein
MPGPQSNINQIVETSATTIGREVLGRDLTSEEAGALKTILYSAAQALSEGFIRRLADQVQAERRDESIEEFFEDNLKTD